MNNPLLGERFQKRFFGLSSVLTTRFPRLGATILDSTVVPLVGNPLLTWHARRHNLRLS